MPVYDYRCRDCGSISEVFLMSERTQAGTCPSCGSPNLERMISGSYTVRMGANTAGNTCCGRAERCDSPPCHTDHECHRR